MPISMQINIIVVNVIIVIPVVIVVILVIGVHQIDVYYSMTIILFHRCHSTPMLFIVIML